MSNSEKQSIGIYEMAIELAQERALADEKTINKLKGTIGTLSAQKEKAEGDAKRLYNNLRRKIDEHENLKEDYEAMTKETSEKTKPKALPLCLILTIK